MSQWRLNYLMYTHIGTLKTFRRYRSIDLEIVSNQISLLLVQLNHSANVLSTKQVRIQRTKKDNVIYKEQHLDYLLELVQHSRANL